MPASKSKTPSNKSTLTGWETKAYPLTVSRAVEKVSFVAGSFKEKSKFFLRIVGAFQGHDTKTQQAQNEYRDQKE